jgi:hypothetical protein
VSERRAFSGGGGGGGGEDGGGGEGGGRGDIVVPVSAGRVNTVTTVGPAECCSRHVI